MNIKPSERVASVQEYYLQRKMKEVAALNAAGADIVSLGVGGPDMPPPPAAVETLCSEAGRASTHGYQVTAGIREYRDAWSRFYARHYGVELDPDTMIQPMIGSKEAILHITMAFINPGDIALVPDPGYPTYTSASRLAGAVVRPYSLTAENGWMPDFDALEQTPLEGVKLMWLNYPHMPTGTPALRSVFEKAVEFGRRHDIVIAHDNPYSFILNDAPMSILQVPGATDVALELNSLSKTFNMAGWRMGMVASNPQYIGWILKVKSNVDSGQFKPAMLAAAAALDADDAWFTALNASYTERRSIAERIMTALGCSFDPLQRGLFLWGRIPESEPGSEAMADRVLRDYRVFITPGFIFGKNGERYIRISLCAPPERLEEALRRITEK
ncbi:MAG: aminotransferase class I/II-fold pyridoxal phosphate-dependent enzyme [Paramuribaculum sp.]|jgi:aspartate/methionine/tyrosine aminotransferase